MFLSLSLSLFAVLTFLVALSPSAQAQYTYRTVDVPFPGVTGAVVTGLTARGTILGIYTDAAIPANLHGFVQAKRGDVRPLLLVTPQDINAGEAITGWFQPPTGGVEAFVYHEGTLHRLQFPRSRPGGSLTPITEALALNDAGVVVGDYQSGEDGVFRGFRYTPAPPTWASIEAPDARSTAAVAITNDGHILVRAFGVDGVTRHYLWDEGVLTELPSIPNLPDVDLVGHTASGLFAGNVGRVGFVWDGTTVEVIEVPGAQLTEIFGLREDGTVYGRAVDAEGVQHGFIATPRASIGEHGGHGRCMRHSRGASVAQGVNAGTVGEGRCAFL